jgi:hypothetical protein
LPGEIGMNFMCLFGNGRFKPANGCRQILWLWPKFAICRWNDRPNDRRWCRLRWL